MKLTIEAKHSSIKAIEHIFPVKKEFKIEEPKVEQVNRILRNIDSKKAKGPNQIPLKLSRCLQILSTFFIWQTWLIATQREINFLTQQK